MSQESVKEYLHMWDAQDRVITFDVSSATVELAAEALGVSPAHIAKTLSFSLKSGCIMIVAAGDAKIDNLKYKTFFHEKARMLTADEVYLITGHPIGGVCPFALDDKIQVFLDISLRRFDTVFPAAGTPQSAVALSCEELYLFAHAIQWIDVCKCWQQEVITE